MYLKGDLYLTIYNYFSCIFNDYKKDFCSLCFRRKVCKLCDECKYEYICSKCKNNKHQEQCFILKDFYNVEFYTNDPLFIILLKIYSKKLFSKVIFLKQNYMYNVIPSKFIENNYSTLVTKFIDFIENNYNLKNLYHKQYLNKSWILSILTIINDKKILIYDNIFKNNIIGFSFYKKLLNLKQSCRPNIELVNYKYNINLIINSSFENKSEISINKLNINLNYFARRKIYKQLYNEFCECDECLKDQNNYKNYFKNQLINESVLIKKYEEDLSICEELSYNNSYCIKLDNNTEFIFFLKKISTLLKIKSQNDNILILYDIIDNFLNYLKIRNDQYVYIMIIELLINYLKNNKENLKLYNYLDNIILWNFKSLKIN